MADKSTSLLTTSSSLQTSRKGSWSLRLGWCNRTQALKTDCLADLQTKVESHQQFKRRSRICSKVMKVGVFLIIQTRKWKMRWVIIQLRGWLNISLCSNQRLTNMLRSQWKDTRTHSHPDIVPQEAKPRTTKSRPSYSLPAHPKMRGLNFTSPPSIYSGKAMLQVTLGVFHRPLISINCIFLTKVANRLAWFSLEDSLNKRDSLLQRPVWKWIHIGKLQTNKWGLVLDFKRCLDKIQRLIEGVFKLPKMITVLSNKKI